VDNGVSAEVKLVLAFVDGLRADGSLDGYEPVNPGRVPLPIGCLVHRSLAGRPAGHLSPSGGRREAAHERIQFFDWHSPGAAYVPGARATPFG
jgi:hypothetical protein